MRSTFALNQTVRNHVLCALPGNELQQLKAHLILVRLVAEQVLSEHRHQTEHLFFIEEGVVSLTACTTWSNPAFQIGMIGPEGLVGCQALLGAATPSFTSEVVKTAGLAHRIRLDDLQAMMQCCPALRAGCMRAVEELMRQVMQTAAFNASNTVEQRCARWLLMAHDRIGGDDVIVTHEGISGQLGVRRSGVTLVLSTLQQAKLIRVGRGRVTILDRSGLERKAGFQAWTTGAVGSRHPAASSGVPEAYAAT